MRKEEFIGIIWGSGFVAQLVRALPCHGRGREFESRRIRQNKALRAIFCGLKIGLSGVYVNTRFKMGGTLSKSNLGF